MWYVASPIAATVAMALFFYLLGGWIGLAFFAGGFLLAILVSLPRE